MVKTIVSFTLPFVIVEEGEYEVSLNKEVIKISISLQQNTEGMKNILKATFSSTGGGRASLTSDPHGIANYTNVKIEFSFLYKPEEFAESLKIGTIPRNKLKQQSILCLNRLVDVVRWSTSQYWIPRVRERDILAFEYIRVDETGKEKTGFSADLGSSREFGIQIRKQSDMKEQIMDYLENEKEIPLDQNLLLDAINYYVMGSFNEAVIIANTALEVLVANHIFEKLLSGGLSYDDADEKLSDILSEGRKNKKSGLHKLLTVNFKEIGKESLEDFSDLWKKFNDARQIRKNAIHPHIKQIKEEECEQTIVTMFEVANWILYKSN